MTQQALEKAKAAIGGSTNLARALGDLTPQAVSQWREVPVMRVIDVERLTGVSRHDLRPDIYPEAAAEPQKVSNE